MAKKITVEIPEGMVKIPFNQLEEFIHWTWGFIQNMIGIFAFIIYVPIDREAKRTGWKKNTLFTISKKFLGGLSLGKFIFVHTNSKEIVNHEIGHTIQSLYLGPFYLLVIGLPSLIWATLKTFGLFKKVEYRSFYTEKWADNLAKKVV